MEKIDCKKFPKAVLYSMFREQKMQVRHVQEQHGIKPTSEQLSTKVRIATIDVQLQVNSQSEEVYVVKKRERLSQIQQGGETEEIQW